MSSNTLEIGRPLSERLSPGMEATLDARYGHLLPGMAESTVNFVYGRQFATDPSLVLGALFA